MSFTGENHSKICKNLADSATFDSLSYPEFKGQKRVVSAECIENDDSSKSTLLIKVTNDATGEIELPPDKVEFPTYEPAPYIEIEDDNDDDDNNEENGNI